MGRFTRFLEGKPLQTTFVARTKDFTVFAVHLDGRWRVTISSFTGNEVIRSRSTLSEKEFRDFVAKL